VRESSYKRATEPPLNGMKSQILHLERAFDDNPALIVMVILAAIAAIFISIVLIDGYVNRRKAMERKRGGK
jgi:hypothetical protein